MKTQLVTLLLLGGSSLLAQTHFSIGVQVGSPRYYGSAVAAPVVVSRPPCPGPGYAWVDGYYDPYGHWFDGYWAVPPYAGAYWVAPRFSGGYYSRGYWGGERYSYRGYPRYREDRQRDGRGRGWREQGYREHGD